MGRRYTNIDSGPSKPIGAIGLTIGLIMIVLADSVPFWTTGNLHLSNNTTPIKTNSTPEPVAKTVEFHGGSFYYIVKGEHGTKFHLYDLDMGSNADKSYMWVCVSELLIAIFATILTCCCGGCCTGVIAFVAGIMGIAASVYVSGFAEDTWGLNVTDSENEWALYVHAFGSAFFTLTAIIMCFCDPKYGTTIVAKRVTTFVRN